MDAPGTIDLLGHMDIPRTIDYGKLDAFSPIGGAKMDTPITIHVSGKMDALSTIDPSGKMDPILHYILVILYKYTNFYQP